MENKLPKRIKYKGQIYEAVENEWSPNFVDFGDGRVFVTADNVDEDTFVKGNKVIIDSNGDGTGRKYEYEFIGWDPENTRMMLLKPITASARRFAKQLNEWDGFEDGDPNAPYDTDNDILYQDHDGFIDAWFKVIKKDGSVIINNDF